MVADNVVYPGAQDFLDYVDTARGAYVTELLDAAFVRPGVEEGLGAADLPSFSTYRGTR